MSVEQSGGQSPDGEGMTWRQMEQLASDPTKRASFIATSNYMRRAMLELAFEMGGQKLIDIVGPRILDRTSVFPVLALSEFEHNRPGITDQVLDRAEKIQRAKHREDWMRSFTGRKRRSTEALLEDPLSPKQQSRVRALLQRRSRNT